jgi:hypothetical protein
LESQRCEAIVQGVLAKIFLVVYFVVDWFFFGAIMFGFVGDV